MELVLALITLRNRADGRASVRGMLSMIPMDLMNGRLNAEAHRRLVQSASEGSFTIMRIWGGGIYMPRT